MMFGPPTPILSPILAAVLEDTAAINDQEHELNCAMQRYTQKLIDYWQEKDENLEKLLTDQRKTQ